MQTTTASSICPLCKGASGTAFNNALPSRLCDVCRSMLATILPQAALGSTVIVDAKMPAAQDSPAEPQAIVAESQEQGHTDIAFQVQSNPAEFVEPQVTQTEPGMNGYSFTTNEEPLHRQPQAKSYDFNFSAQAEPEEKAAPALSQSDNLYADFSYQAAEKTADVQIQTEEAIAAASLQNQPGAEAESLPQPQSFAAEFVEPQQTFVAGSLQPPQAYEAKAFQAEEESQPVYYDNRLAAPAQEYSQGLAQLEKEPDAHPQAATFYVVPENQQLVAQETWGTPDSQSPSSYTPAQDSQAQQFYPQTAQPLYAPEPQIKAPATKDLVNQWDASVDNYPVLMVKEEKRPLSKALLALAAIAVLALAAAGYFFVYKPFFGSKPATPAQRAGATIEDTKPSAPPVKPNESAQVAPNATPPAETKPATPNETKPETDVPAGQGKVSLQAASFPNEQAAKEFSEKLIHSGVPAYIASADIAGKGRWFRVRVGRFASPADAEKYAGQAKQRAKAAGVNLQLVVCDYSNP
jgi:hypothetical protein